MIGEGGDGGSIIGMIGEGGDGRAFDGGSIIGEGGDGRAFDRRGRGWEGV